MTPQRRDVVVIGASAGGVSVLCSLAGQLPPSFAASVFVVMHLRPDVPSRLTNILSRAGRLPAQSAKDAQGRLMRKSIKHAVFDEAWVEAGDTR